MAQPTINNNFIFNEPTYAITKREWFDEDYMKQILIDDNFCKNDRKHLTEYNKHRLSGSQVSTTYKFGLGCEGNRLGRLFPEDGIGLQSFRFDIRNPLAKKFYWDTDIANAHYRIAEKFANDYGLKTEYLDQYINNRDNCLKLVSNSRKKAKTEFLNKTLYLGNAKLYNEAYNEVDGEITLEGFNFIQHLQKEMENLANIIWDKHKHLHKLKTGKENKPICKKPT